MGNAGLLATFSAIKIRCNACSRALAIAHVHRDQLNINFVTHRHGVLCPAYVHDSIMRP